MQSLLCSLLFDAPLRSEGTVRSSSFSTLQAVRALCPQGSARQEWCLAKSVCACSAIAHAHTRCTECVVPCECLYLSAPRASRPCNTPKKLSIPGINNRECTCWAFLTHCAPPFPLPLDLPLWPPSPHRLKVDDRRPHVGAWSLRRRAPLHVANIEPGGTGVGAACAFPIIYPMYGLHMLSFGHAVYGHLPCNGLFVCSDGSQRMAAPARALQLS